MGGAASTLGNKQEVEKELSEEQETINEINADNSIIYNKGDDDKRTLLHWASEEGYLDLIAKIFEVCEKDGRTAEVFNAKDDIGTTALHNAARSGQEETCKFLIEKGCEVNEVNNYADSPLHCAAELGQVSTCRALLEKGANPDNQNEDENTPYHLAQDNIGEEEGQISEDTSKEIFELISEFMAKRKNNDKRPGSAPSPTNSGLNLTNSQSQNVPDLP